MIFFKPVSVVPQMSQLSAQFFLLTETVKKDGATVKYKKYCIDGDIYFYCLNSLSYKHINYHVRNAFLSRVRVHIYLMSYVVKLRLLRQLRQRGFFSFFFKNNRSPTTFFVSVIKWPRQKQRHFHLRGD